VHNAPAGLLAVLVVIAFAGLTLIRDIGGITHRLQTATARWWSRRRFGLRTGNHYRALGYWLVAADLVVIAILIIT
jgi:hypothetical protein